MIVIADEVVPLSATPVHAPGIDGNDEWARAHFLFALKMFARTAGMSWNVEMAVQLDQIRAVAQQVAASHDLELVDLEFMGGGKHRALRIFVEKNASERAKLAALAETGEVGDRALPQLPKGVPVELLSGVTHEDCAKFAQDFGTLLDVEDLIPGSEYTLEVSSPGLERKLSKAEDFSRFQGSLIKVQTFSAVNDTGTTWDA